MSDDAGLPSLEGSTDAGEDVGDKQLGVPAFDRRQRVESHGRVARFGDEASGVSEEDVLEPVDVGSELVPNETEKTPDPAHSFAGFVHCLVGGYVAPDEDTDCVVEMFEAEPLDTRG